MIGNSVCVKDQWMINDHTIRTFGTTTKSQTNDPHFIHQSYYHVKTGTNENYIIKTNLSWSEIVKAWSVMAIVSFSG